MAGEEQRSVVTFGGNDAIAPGPSGTSISASGPAAAQDVGAVAAGLWPTWAAEQLGDAVDIAGTASGHTSVARLLHREWFTARVGEFTPMPRPLAGIYRSAHAGSALRSRRGGLSVLGRYDLIGPDGWWRTWGEAWTPPRTRPGSVRLMLTPRADRLAELVETVTGTLLGTRIPWSLGCSTAPRRIARLGGAALDVGRPDDLPAGLLDDLAPLLEPVTPPLCLPVAVGVGAAEYPDNGMTFGEHRCHLVALGLRRPRDERDPLRSIADAFTAHGIDPAQPHRAGRR